RSGGHLRLAWGPSLRLVNRTRQDAEARSKHLPPRFRVNHPPEPAISAGHGVLRSIWIPRLSPHSWVASAPLSTRSLVPVPAPLRPFPFICCFLFLPLRWAWGPSFIPPAFSLGTGQGPVLWLQQSGSHSRDPRAKAQTNG